MLSFLMRVSLVTPILLETQDCRMRMTSMCWRLRDRAACEAIITMNLRDFPNAILGEFNIAAIHPDDFLLTLFEQNADDFLDAARAILARLRNPPYSVAEYLALREQDGLVATVAALRAQAHRLA